MSYQTLVSLKDRRFADRKVVLVGAAWMANEYCKALQALGVTDCRIVSQTLERSGPLAENYGYQAVDGGYAARLPGMQDADLVILSLPEHECLPALDVALAAGHKNILVEKPASLYANRLRAAAERGGDARVRVAYNRVGYPNFIKLKELLAAEGGATSAHYLITELVHTINFENNQPDTYARWGCSNTLHVISMAHALIGMPAEMSCYRGGGFDWHPTGDRFHGAGRTVSGCLFTYQGDWQSAGRWGIDVMTAENAYRLMPMEQLFVMKKGTFSWEPVDFEVPFPEVKQGVAEEVAVMLDPGLETNLPLVSLPEAAAYTALAEQIFGYESE